jgi:hypothetical protein
MEGKPKARRKENKGLAEGKPRPAEGKPRGLSANNVVFSIS